MKRCSNPCSECPFRKDSLAGWLSNYTTEELHNIIMSEKKFPCHMSHLEKMIDWNDAGTSKYPLCAGALLYMKKACKLPKNTELAGILKTIEMDDTKNILSVPEFFKHHQHAKE